MADPKIVRWRRGHENAEARAREVVRREGPRPEQAVAESLSALSALEEMGLWPGPRDPVSERGVEAVRSRWARIGRHAKNARHG